MSNIEQLKKNVAATLESTGALARIRAELRAEVFAAIEMQTPSSSNNIPQKVDEFARDEYGQSSIDLVVEFLQFFGLKHTLSVFKSETHRSDVDVNRDALWDAVAPTKSEFSLRRPILVALLDHNRRDHGMAVPEGRAPPSRHESQPQTATVYHAEPQNSSTTPLSMLIAAKTPLGDASQNDVERRDPEPARASARTTPDTQPSSMRKEVDRLPSASIPTTTTTFSSTLPAAKEAKSGSNPMNEQLHQIEDLLKQLDTKQKLTDLAKAQLKADSHHLVEDFSDNDDVEFDDEDFEYEPDEVVKGDSDELFPGFSTRPAPPPAPRPVLPDMVECFSDDPSADEGALDAFDVVHEVRLISQRTM